MKAIRDGTTTQAVEDFFKKRDGTAIPVQYYVAPLILDDEVKGAVVSFFDTAARKEAQRRSATQYAMTSVLSQAESVQEAAPRILAQICEHNGFQAAIFWQIEEQGENLELVDSWHEASIDLSEWERSYSARPLKRGEGLAGRVWAANAPLWIGRQSGELAQQLIAAAVKQGMLNAFAFPVRSDETILGVIELLQGRSGANPGALADAQCSGQPVLASSLSARPRKYVSRIARCFFGSWQRISRKFSGLARSKTTNFSTSARLMSGSGGVLWLN